MKFICRQSHDLGASLFDYPLSGQYDEMDSLAVFDDVLIPWERVFAFEDVPLANYALTHVEMWRQYMQQVAVKNIAKLEFILGITHGIVEGIGIGIYGHVQEKVSEIIDILETVRAYMRAAEAEPWIAMRNWYPDAYSRVVWILEQLSASGLMLTPSENDLQGPIADTIGKYYQAATMDASQRIGLFRLAWDLVGTEFGSRQTLYERFFNGDVVRLRQRRFDTYDYSRAKESLRSFRQHLARMENASTDGDS